MELPDPERASPRHDGAGADLGSLVEMGLEPEQPEPSPEPPPPPITNPFMEPTYTEPDAQPETEPGPPDDAA